MNLTANIPTQPTEIAERLYLDFDSFFATAEQYFNPALRGRPVGVMPIDSPHSGCIAVSREAKRMGVPAMASVAVARQHAPDIILVIARPDAYVRLHNRILEAIETCLPIANVRSIDELVCHLLPSEAAQPEILGRRIKQALADRFNPMLTCSIGIAKTELLAKIAAEMNKPDGLAILSSTDLPQRLAHLELNDLPGISKGMGARLANAGVTNFEALWGIGPKHARAIWGNIEGERFWNGLHGHHFERPETIKRMFGHSRMLPVDWRSTDKVHACARQLALSAARRLRRGDVRATKLTFGMRGGRSFSNSGKGKNQPRWGCEITFRPARDDRTFLHALSEGIARSTREARFSPRSVSVTLHGLEEAQAVQSDLFAVEIPQTDRFPCTATAKWERLSDTLDGLRSKHGPSAISLGPKDDVPGGYLGAKIAFGRIPDAADFNEAQTEDSATHFCSV
ncbi:type VI secretion protein ImpB [Ahrensia sp. R2A130]|uniref:Y-family DNA polymerase n=1 Tax=Ahrensia sp. R2A130 TaxID=744979 RepID=UPI0001E0C9D8|nr:type VI secretion protein ImpB [Ahrensia sp. R2A130]EFL89386.1 DNA-directed DNA polymerase [Ahrensia sp. R2A130]